MAAYRDPNAPAGRVVLGGVPFVDGLTGDIAPGPETLKLFAAVGIVEVPTEPVSPAPDPVEQVDEPAPKPRKK